MEAHVITPKGRFILPCSRIKNLLNLITGNSTHKGGIVLLDEEYNGNYGCNEELAIGTSSSCTF